MKLYVQCNPLLDISAVVTEDLMTKYSVGRAVAILMGNEQQGIFEELEKKPDVKYVPGGSGLNTARVAQWILQAPKGSFSMYVGCAADDRYGKILKESAEADGVTMVLEYTKKEPTGSCAVCITGKERSLVANLAAANHLSEEHMHSAEVQKHLEEAKLFYLTSFTLTVNVNYVLHVAQKARAVDGIFMMNLSAPFLIEFFGEQFNQVLPYVDVIFANEVEAHTLAKVKKWDAHNVPDITRRALQELPYSGTKNRLIVITQGAHATVCATKDEVLEVPVPPLDTAKMVDLNGAGDAFVGGFLAAYALGRDLKCCCDAGHYAAQTVIQHSGCTYPEKPSITL
ncbi:putative adenosine kinase [Trypanosoma grayi]|uniref:putative adenosine kinase n=1 Tax=Trypanosoma grayi TaxID=71804 RepID=UPI0004F430F1|nr:putative adenosine kinase [Trypanosoma grayi]KEG09351.1 putative adenosine kinase [Trypanosoma grayi]